MEVSILKKRCSAYYEIIIKTLVFITLIATAISFFGVFTTYLNVNYAARRVTREIEISGRVSTDTYSLFNEMKTNMGNVHIADNAAWHIKNERLSLENVKLILTPDDFSIVRTLTEHMEKRRGFN